MSVAALVALVVMVSGGSGMVAAMAAMKQPPPPPLTSPHVFSVNTHPSRLRVVQLGVVAQSALGEQVSPAADCMPSAQAVHVVPISTNPFQFWPRAQLVHAPVSPQVAQLAVTDTHGAQDAVPPALY